MKKVGAKNSRAEWAMRRMEKQHQYVGWKSSINVQDGKAASIESGWLKIQA